MLCCYVSMQVYCLANLIIFSENSEYEINQLYYRHAPSSFCGDGIYKIRFSSDYAIFRW